MRNFRTPAARYPADPRVVFILVACILSGLNFLAGAPAPGTVESQLDRGWVVVWAILIGLGGLVTLIGSFRLDVAGILLEQVGSLALLGGTGVYAVAVWTTIGGPGFYPGMFQLAFGVASLWRWGQLQSHLNAAQRQADGEAQ